MTSIKYDGEVIIAIGCGRFEKVWENKTIEWSELLEKLSRSRESSETHKEYMAMPKDKQDDLKDIGGFVGGHLNEGRRKNGYVRARQIITLDADFPSDDFWERVVVSGLNCALCIYSTHKHTKAKPRLRLIIPLNREVSADEYEAISRKVAEKIGMDDFDDSSFQPARLMYWPSHSKDCEPVFRFVDMPFLDADSILNEYADWKDVSSWPYSSRVQERGRKAADKQGEPTEKPGVVGAFCRAYSVPEAIAEFLPDVYTETAREDRYTYAAGSTAGGLVIYDDGKFAYSNHSTDPAGGRLCNSFDLVRIHKFGQLDEKSAGRVKNVTDLPSYKAMSEFVLKDGKARGNLAPFMQNEKEEEEKDWHAELDINPKTGMLINNAKNALLILENDDNLKGIAFNELSGEIDVFGKLPWRHIGLHWADSDYSQLYLYISLNYGIDLKDRLLDKAFSKVVCDRAFNPLKDYICSLPEWDGVKRIERLFIDYLAAEDKEYNREVAKKMMTAAVARVLEPGIKFDEMIVLQGIGGIGKSTLLKVLGGEWYSDSLDLTDIKDKTGAEKLQGVWIMEVGEMQGMRKADRDNLKSFISREEDSYRVPYERTVRSHPRTCIICGTTNNTDGFLKDTTGNRKFWPIKVYAGAEKKPWDITEEERNQLWAEAAVLFAAGEDIYFDARLEELAKEEQREALEYDEREGIIVDYLDTLIPADWYSMDTAKRADYFQDEGLGAKEKGTEERQYVSLMEIYCECFGKAKSSWKRQDGYELAAIMARIPGWTKDGKTKQIKGYGHQRVYCRKPAEELF